MTGSDSVFYKILHANDGSEPAFRAFAMALAVAKQNNSDLHMVSVEEIDYMPEFIEEVREQAGTAARRFHKVLQRARGMAEDNMSNSRRMSSPGILCEISSNSPKSLKLSCSLSEQPAIQRYTTD